MNYLALFFLIGFTSAFAKRSVKDKSDWIDPHDMNAKVKHKYLPTGIRSPSSDITVDPLQDICYSHIKRVVSVIIKSAHMDKSDPEQYHGHLRFNIDPKDFDFLDKFGQEDITLDKLRQLNTILGSSFHKSFIDSYLNTVESFQIKIYHMIVNLDNLWLLGAIWIIYVTFQLFKHDFSIAYIVKYLIIMVMIVDFGFRYHHLLKEADEHNMAVVYSSECDPSKMSWSEWAGFMFNMKNCEKKTVTPLDAFLYQIKHLIIIPMHAFGTGMGGFGKNMFVGLPWGLNLIMWPLMLVFTLLFTIFLMTILTGQSIELNMLHMLKMKFGGGSNDALPAAKTKHISHKAVHRPMVQDVSEKNINKRCKNNKKQSQDMLQIGAGDGSKGVDKVVVEKKKKNAEEESGEKSKNISLESEKLTMKTDQVDKCIKDSKK
ncbi:uncharacterized protein LOC126742252 [Anthonomus grandis grandis]|uniref:uncharacterized protein LOC126742252 n=1 Tax=Anthonomus grandis grandis TaxID=2921223 RepID=UPI0021651486|nr:uncharacterized protein LOC126742252 [Anthonomus grandis grandis]